MSVLSWLVGYDTDNAKAAEAADAELRRLNAERANTLGTAWLAQVDKNYSTQNAIGVAAQEKEIDAAFAEGLQDGANNITGFVSGAFKFVGKALASVLLGIPLWVWLGAGVVVWFYLGAPGLKTLKKKLPA